MAKYRINSTEARNDGSGLVKFEVQALANDDTEIPGRHATFLFPNEDVQSALNKANPSKEIYKLIDKALPDKGWGDEAELDEMAQNNANAIVVDGNMDDWAGTYPIEVSK